MANKCEEWDSEKETDCNKKATHTCKECGVYVCTKCYKKLCGECPNCPPPQLIMIKE